MIAKLEENVHSYVMENDGEANRLEQQALAEKELIDRLLQESMIAKGMVGIDVGCGTGAITRILAEYVGPNGKVYGLDRNAQRLESANLLSNKNKITNTLFFQSDAKEIGLPPSSVDFSWSRYLLEYFHDPNQIVMEMKRITKPGGIVAIHDINGWFFENMDDVLKSRFDRTIRQLRNDTGLNVKIGEELDAILTNCGLSNVQEFRHEHNFKNIGEVASDLIISDWETRLNTLMPHTIKALGSKVNASLFNDDFMSFLRNPETAMHTNTVFVTGIVPV